MRSLLSSGAGQHHANLYSVAANVNFEAELVKPKTDVSQRLAEYLQPLKIGRRMRLSCVFFLCEFSAPRRRPTFRPPASLGTLPRCHISRGASSSLPTCCECTAVFKCVRRYSRNARTSRKYHQR